MERTCGTCHWWQKIKASEPRSCNCVDSDNRFDYTAEDYSCNKWQQTLEQDGEATWYIDLTSQILSVMDKRKEG